jgi:GNAT superfamily N-acetyltransferase
MEQTTRRLTHDDVGVVAQMERDARESLRDERGGAALLAECPQVGDWGGLVDSPDHPVWVSVIDDVVVGYLALTIDNGVARVAQVYVDPMAREVGFGDWLLEAAIEEARRRGCRTIESYALPGDRATKNLYERAGITARKIIVSKSL